MDIADINWYDMTKYSMILAMVSILLIFVTKWWWVALLGTLALTSLFAQLHNMVILMERDKRG